MRLFTPSRDAVTTLLEIADLPVDDLPEHLDHFLACGEPGSPDGVVGLEIFHEEALLRSLVVAEMARGRGLGKNLVSAAEDLAGRLGTRRIFLLTDTAEAFFARLGYEPADRESAPRPIRESRQFSELCPANAAFMMKALDRSSN